MIKGYHSNIMKVYENIRESEEKSLKDRKEEIEKKIPEVLNIEREIGKICVKMSMNILNNSENSEE
jgi:DNA replication protein DnaC